MRAIAVTSFAILLLSRAACTSSEASPNTTGPNRSFGVQQGGVLNAGNNVVWVDATGAVIAPYIRGEFVLGENIGGTVAIQYIDDAGFVWALDPENALVSPTFTLERLCFDGEDCTGHWYVPIQGINQPGASEAIRPREVIRTLPGLLQARADDVAGERVGFASCSAPDGS